MSEKLPKMPEPAVMCDCGGDYYTASQVLSLQRDTWMRAMEVAAKLVEPQYKRPCDCERCDCHNVDDAQAVAQWDESKSIAAAIRALPMPEGGE
jgi:hypothetical protein